MSVRMLMTCASVALCLAACGEPTTLERIDQSQTHGVADMNKGHVAPGRVRHEGGGASHGVLDELGARGTRKVSICHVPPGNPANTHLIRVSESAVAQHVRRHGDGICGAGATDCCGLQGGGSLCTSFRRDASNCGACGVHCAVGETCSGGSCSAGESTPPAGTPPPGGGGGDPAGGGTPGGCVSCGDACVDLQSDRNNCGACGHMCAPDSPGCTSGVCTRKPCTVDTDCGPSQSCSDFGECVVF